MLCLVVKPSFHSIIDAKYSCTCAASVFVIEIKRRIIFRDGELRSLLHFALRILIELRGTRHAFLWDWTRCCLDYAMFLHSHCCVSLRNIPISDSSNEADKSTARAKLLCLIALWSHKKAIKWKMHRMLFPRFFLRLPHKFTFIA